MSESNSLSRRDFVKTAGTAAAASLVLTDSALASVSAPRRRYAIVGTGDRATRHVGTSTRPEIFRRDRGRGTL